MKVAIFTAGLFLLSYIAVNSGLGDNPGEVILPMIVVFGFVGGVRWLRRRGRQKETRSSNFRSKIDSEVIGEDSTRRSPDAPRAGGRGAKKLF